MDSGQIVVLSCSAPREKFWGVLQGLTAVGATVRAVPLDAFEDFLGQFRDAREVQIAPMTVFLPGHRLERIELDESGGGIEGMADRFRRLTGLEPLEVLLGRSASSPSDPQM